MNLPDMRDVPTWDGAHCAAYYPIFTDDQVMTIVERKRVCRGCPVRRACATYAVRTRPAGVVMGGQWIADYSAPRERAATLLRLKGYANTPDTPATEETA